MKGIISTGLRLMAAALVSALLLAGTNALTKEPIAAQIERKAHESREAVMPEGGGFDKIEGDFGGVGVYKNEEGFVFEITAQGYGRKGVGVTVGVLFDGTISGVRVDASNETPGLGTDAGKEAYYGQYQGKTASGLGGVNAITGATVTSSAVKRAVELALKTFETINKSGGGGI